ncbi:MAG: hypothetical protein IJV83_03290 [Clostridia bacterium]|nr:hypothetical protein [Clostridia bacterium]
MGKKKSVVLITLLTIVIAVLCAITAFPTFRLPWSANKKDSWNPAVLQYDLGRDFGDGYYTYYYPNGVISETEYETEVAALNDAAAALTGEKKAEAEEKLADYVAAYVHVDGIDGLYFSTNEDDAVLKSVKNDAGEETWVISEDFDAAFQKAANEVKNRYAAKEYEYHTVSVVNQYMLRIELGAGEKTETDNAKDPSTNASQAFTLFNMFGEFTFMQDGANVSAFDGETTVKDLIKKIDIKKQYEVAHLRIKFTGAGKSMLKAFKSSGGTSLDIAIGGEKMLSISPDYINDKNEVEYPLAEQGDIRYAETIAVLLNSLKDTGVIYIGEEDANTPIQFAFRKLDGSSVRSFTNDYGSNVLYWVFGGLLTIMVALMVLAVVKMGRFGIVNVYTNLSYFIITALCFAFITEGVLELSAAAIMMFLFGLVMVNLFHNYTYSAIKKDFMQGKTVQSSVKGGYKKTLWNTIDVYAVLILAAFALLIGVANLHTLAIHALICLISAAFCNLLWGRGINHVLLSASKNKYKYFRFVREDDDDED